jgi:hypothetical protein
VTDDLHPVHKAYADALEAGGPAVIDLGRDVLCDFCSTDLTDDPRSGGFMFGTYAVGPCCAEEKLASIRGYGEEDQIGAWCPPGMSFADWVRHIRQVTGSNAITITPGWPRRSP